MLLSTILSQHSWNSGIQSLSSLRNCKTVGEIHQFHARMITTGLIKNPSLTTKLILSLSSSPQISLVQFARYLFFTHHAFRDGDQIADRRDPFLWNAIIKTYSHGDEPRQALFIFALMLKNGVSFDNFSLSLVLKSCSRVGCIEGGLQLHGLLIKLGFGSDLFLQNCLIALYVRCGFLDIAGLVFAKMSKRDAVSYNSMIDGYAKCGKIDLAQQLFESMPVRDRNLTTWNCLISGYAKSEDGLGGAWELFEKMPQRDLFSWNSMIDCCVKFGKIEDAQTLFDRMPRRDNVSWASMICGNAKLGKMHMAKSLFDETPEKDIVVCNAMMSGYVQNGYFFEALDMFQSIQSANNLFPDEATLSIVLSATAQVGEIDRGVATHRYIEANGFSTKGKLGVCLIDMYSKCGSINNAMLIFEAIEDKTVDHWNAMIGGLAVHGFGDMAIDLLMEMVRTSVKPDDITFIGLLSACCHSGLVKEGMICFELLRRVYKMEPKLQHYGCMVDILCRAGHREEAIRFVDEMPSEPNEIIWRTLLAACRDHESLNVRKLIARRLLSEDPWNSSSYVLLSNIYASLGMWDGVKRLRTTMVKRNMRKIPGCSSIKLEGTVHEFFVQDSTQTHPQVAEIYSLLYKL
ncbi:Pentatricopeptide repeat-containing protein At2g45350, chloroplastic [Linum perenne]